MAKRSQALAFLFLWFWAQYQLCKGEKKGGYYSIYAQESFSRSQELAWHLHAKGAHSPVNKLSGPKY